MASDPVLMLIMPTLHFEHSNIQVQIYSYW